MGILRGGMTVRRFRVAGDLPDGDWRDLFRERLNEFAFQEPPQGQGKEEVEGWVQVHNLLDTSFDDYNKWLYNDYAVFALRVDKKRLPAKLLKATLEKKCEAWCKEREVERCPSTIKTDIKEMLEKEWLERTLPSVAVTEIAWHISQNVLIVHSLSEGVAERLRTRFHRTFGLKLVPWSPLDYLDDSELTAALLNEAPTITRDGVEHGRD